MRTLHTILLATDFRPASREAARAATRLATIFGSRVSLLRVLDPMPAWPVALHLLRELAEDAMRDLEQDLDAHEVTVSESAIEVGPISDTIVRKAQARDVDLIVIGAGERSEFARFSVGSVAEAVLQHATRPVLAVRPGSPSLEFRAILCPVDHSRTSRRGLENAIRLARAFGSRLLVLSVVPETAWITAAVETGKLVGAFEEYERTWAEEFDQMLAQVDFGDVPWERLLRTGEVPEVIDSTAQEEGVDLIVMGSIGRTGLARALMGSVTRTMLRGLPCSLLVVKNDDLLEELYEGDLQAIQEGMDEGRALLRGRAPNDAIPMFREVLQRHPYHVAALESLAEAYDQIGNTAEAERCRHRAQAIRNPM